MHQLIAWLKLCNIWNNILVPVNYRNTNVYFDIKSAETIDYWENILYLLRILNSFKVQDTIFLRLVT